MWKRSEEVCWSVLRYKTEHECKTNKRRIGSDTSCGFEVWSWFAAGGAVPQVRSGGHGAFHEIQEDVRLMARNICTESSRCKNIICERGTERCYQEAPNGMGFDSRGTESGADAAPPRAPSDLSLELRQGKADFSMKIKSSVRRHKKRPYY